MIAFRRDDVSRHPFYGPSSWVADLMFTFNDYTSRQLRPVYCVPQCPTLFPLGQFPPPRLPNMGSTTAVRLEQTRCRCHFFPFPFLILFLLSLFTLPLATSTNLYSPTNGSNYKNTAIHRINMNINRTKVRTKSVISKWHFVLCTRFLNQAREFEGERCNL